MHDRRYFGQIRVTEADTTPNGPRPKVYDPKAYLQRFRSWNEPEKPAGALLLWLHAFRCAGNHQDQKLLNGILNDPRLQEEIDEREKALLRICGRVALQKASTAAQLIAEFKKRNPAESLSEADAEELHALEVLVDHLHYIHDNSSPFITVSPGDSAKSVCRMVRWLFELRRAEAARKAFRLLLEKDRLSSNYFSLPLARLIETHGDRLGNKAWAALQQIGTGDISGGLNQLLRLAYLRSTHEEEREEAALALFSILLSTSDPLFGETEAWHAAEESALLPDAAIEPNRAELDRLAKAVKVERNWLRKKRHADKHKQTFNVPAPSSAQSLDEDLNTHFERETNRFLRIRHWFALHDFGALSAELKRTGPTYLEQGISTSLEIAQALQVGDEATADKAAKAFMSNKVDPSFWIAGFIKRALKAALFHIGVSQMTERLQAELEEAEYFHRSAMIIQQFVSELLFKACSPQENIAANEKLKHLSSEIDDAVRGRADARSFESLLADLRSYPQQFRTGSWWNCGSDLLMHKEANIRFTPHERLAILLAARDSNDTHLDNNRTKRSFINARLLAAQGIAAVSKNGMTKLPALPLALAPFWFDELERQGFCILRWQTFQCFRPVRYVVLEKPDDVKNVLLATTDAPALQSLFMPFKKQAGRRIECVLEIPKTLLDSEGVPPDWVDLVLYNALNIEYTVLKETGDFTRDEIFQINFPKGAKRHPDFFSLAMGEPEEAPISPIHCEPAKGSESIEFSPVYGFRKAEDDALALFNWSEMRDRLPKGFFNNFDPKRARLIKPAKLLVPEEKAANLLKDETVANTLCFAERAIVEKGKPVMCAAPILSGENGEHCLFFLSQLPKDELRLPNPVDDVPLKI